RRRTSTICFTRHGAEALAPTGRQAKAHEAGGILVPLLLLLILVVEVSSPVTTAVLVAPTLLVGASLVAVAVVVVVGVVVLATAGLLGAIGDEVVQITTMVAPGVLPPLPVVVDMLELADEKAQVV